MRIRVHRRATTWVHVERSRRVQPTAVAVVVAGLMLVFIVVVVHLAVLPPIEIVVLKISSSMTMSVQLAIRLVNPRRPSVFRRGIVDLRLESATAVALAARNDARLLVLVHHPHADSARQTPEQEQYDAEADGRFGHFALAHTAPGEGLAVAQVGCVVVVFVVLLAFLYALRLPDSEGDGGCEPEEGEEQV